MESQSPLATSTPATSTAQPMLQDIEDLTISLMIKSFNPTILSYEFLTMTGILPNSWELAKQPINNPRGSQVSFKNGVEITAQANALNFRQPLNQKQEDSDNVDLATIAQRCIEKMSSAEYQGLSISPKIIIPFPEEDGGRDFIHDTFFNNGSWRNFGNSSVQASLTLSYELEQCRLGVNINPAKLQQPNNIAIAAVLFAGNFNYSLANEASEQNTNALKTQLNNWERDVKTFRDLVYKKFLQKAPTQQESLFDN